MTPELIANITRQEQTRHFGLVSHVVFQVAIVPVTPDSYLVLTVFVSSLNSLEFNTEQSLYRSLGSGIIVRERKVFSQFTIDPNEVI